MAKDKITEWDVDPANNTVIADIGIVGTSAVANFDNAVRTAMSQVAKVNAGTDPVADTWSFGDPSDLTKIVRLNAGSLPTATTHAINAAWLQRKSADIASATTTDLSTATGGYIHITGTTTITGLGTVAAGIPFMLQFDGAVPLTYNATSFILKGGQSRTTAAGDTGLYVSEGSGNWRELFYQQAAPKAWIDGGVATTTSATNHDFTGIPSWASEIELIFNNVSTNGTSALRVQLGDSGGIETTGYDGAIGVLTASPSYTSITDGVGLPVVAANAARYGVLRFSRFNSGSNGWGYVSNIIDTSNSAMGISSGFKVLSDALTQVRLTTAGGSDTFDTGSVYLKYR